jgi:integrase
VAFFEHIAAYAGLYRALLGRTGSPWFVWKMRTALADLVNERGHRPRTIMEILGHSQISTTMNIYRHVLEETQSAADLSFESGRDASLRSA